MSAAGVFELDSEVDGEEIVARVAAVWGERNGEVSMWNRWRPDVHLSSAKPPTPEEAAIHEAIGDMANRAMNDVVAMLSRDFGIEAELPAPDAPVSRGSTKDSWPPRGTCPDLYASDKEWVCTIAWYVSEEQRDAFEAAARVLCELARGDVYYYRDGMAMSEAGLDPEDPLPEVRLRLDDIGRYPPEGGDTTTRYVLPGGSSESRT